MHRLRGDQEKYDAMEVSVLVFFFLCFFWIFGIERIIGLAGKCWPVDYFVLGLRLYGREKRKKSEKKEKKNILGKAVRLGWVLGYLP